MKDWKRIILNETGMSAEDFTALAWEQGVAFLEMMESDDPKLLARLMRSSLYWKWWNKQIGLLCISWINKLGLDRIRATRKAHNRDHLQTYLDICRVQDNGMVSYCYLVEELIGTGGKR
ncbi:hypothetical protein [Flavilitoribacter nigricans]|uniref:Uncharacterized protein n=1 Tax=Flavilitoribacter nigricans (strain ATCC 23147 / DSM 23189 / NBRC 102662 / NCIMB 1420 / SS-2) TaxID=1122177 RepID=A0A2D0MWP3_FLAN2|nr:hypothetical protein [Flavilitoribacter nigricans]PHN00655.1 hypothetical protein CRP01_41070 [Flavilitoribacter nigricans DSM 23189 = NBRC 102662]